MRLRGTTLLELVVTTALMAVLMTAVAELFVAAHQYYRRFDATVEVQKDALMSLHLITHELGESNADAISVFPNPAAPTEPPGIVFASPRTDTGDIFLSSRTNLLEWRGFVCYYLAQVNGTSCLVRKREPFDTPKALPPLDLLATRTTSFYIADVTWQARVIARNITNLTITPGEPIGINITSQVKSGGDFKVTVSSKISVRN